MGEIILNGRSYNNGTKYLEVTQAQYNALPASKLTDGTLYCITDAPGPGEGFPPMIYSYEEREVGVWIDGKPLYQKTVNIPAIAAGTNEYQLDFGIITVDKIIDIQSIIFSSNSCMILPYPLRSNVEQYGVYQQGFNTSTGELRIDTGDQRAVDFGYSTITYTKTTDTPGSGTWTTQGTIAHHYDGDEKVIGTWFGETLYEKSWELTVKNHSSHWVTFTECAIPNFKAAINIEWSFTWGQRNYCPWDNNGTFMFNNQNASSAEFYAQSNQYSGQTLYYIVQYTKTTD